MAFELRVKFAGLCLYLIHSDSKRVAVVMPDARRNKPNPHSNHIDKDEAEPHAGYLRFDLANLDSGATGIKPGTVNGPMHEGIHRFSLQEIDFGLGDTGAIKTGELLLPDFKTFAPGLEPHPDLFAANPASSVLMRTVLRGGTLSGKGRKNWKVPKLHPEGADHAAFFAGDVRWTQKVENADTLTLRIRGFDKAEEVTIPLKPVKVGSKDVISLTIANLCCNPLEWEELTSPTGNGPDRDFKWLYRLLKPRTGTKPYEELLAGDKELPHPTPGSPFPFGREHCIGGKLSNAEFTE